MFNSIRGRIIVIIAMLLVSAYYLATNGIKLGLDLQGGMHLVLEVDDPEGTMTEDARADAIERSERIMRNRIDEFGVEEPIIQKVGCCRLIVELPGIGPDDESRAKNLIEQAAFLEFKLVLPVAEFESRLPQIDRQIVNVLGMDSLQALGGVAQGPSQELQNLLFDGLNVDSTQADSTGVDEDAEEQDQSPNLIPLQSLLLIGDMEGVFLVATENVERARLFLALPEVQRAFPRNVSLHWEADPIALDLRPYRRLYVTTEEAFVDGTMLEDATAQRDPNGNQAQVNFEFNRVGGRRFSRFTEQNIGNLIAIVLDGEIVSAPVVRARIGASGVIEMGNADMAEAADLALVLRAGALPTKLVIVEERTVGPSLGQDSIDRGQIAGIIGMFAVVLIMISYYRVVGVLAVMALAVYMTLVLGGLAAFNGVLTLPGIAGLILSVGMAVDANVLIFERIREELILGRATRTAVEEGFAHALSAIVDANMTTLFTALILFQFGTGPVRGFAVTLSIGIVASFFSALYVTRTFFLIYLSGKKASDPISI
ncbi:MAG: protein translocase subunit SecD [Gemmatimonadetes bacterium]|nr:protein translocase subunit SecD [Gemmatimonadota bacterium]